jgi:peroxiredoxin
VQPRLEAEGVALFAVSYDPVAVLRSFADTHAIAFPLLSDERSHVIRRLGLINDRVQEDHAVYGIKPDPRHTDLPYPGVFVLDEAGVIVGKQFHESYRERDTGAALLAQTLSILEPRPRSTAEAPGHPIQVSAWLDSPTYSFFQRLHLNVELRMAPGFRIFAPPAPDGRVPLTVHVSEIPGVEIGAVQWPAAQPGRVPGLDGLVLRHSGTIRGLVPLTFAAPPGGGDLTVELAVRYQGCSDSERLLPSSVGLRLRIKEVAMVDRTLPSREGA